MNIKEYIDKAIREQLTITIKYVKYEGEISTRTISDLNYSDEFGDEYIECYCHLRNERRTFKISRIMEADGIKSIMTNNTINRKNKSAYTPNTTYYDSSKEWNYDYNRDNYFYREKVKKHKKEGCYIATMVYGDYDNPKVIILRRFRDECLLTTKAGILFVKIYYFISPKLVRMLKNKKRINIIIRCLLDKFVKLLANNGG